MSGDIEPLDWTVRHFIYAHTAAHGLPPTIAEVETALSIGAEQARGAYERLHDHHAILLQPQGHTVRMASPFSGVPTSFRVQANGCSYWANCAWDALGIPAMLAADARVDARCAGSARAIMLGVENGGVRGHGEVVHFAVPFRRWYDDLDFT